MEYLQDPFSRPKFCIADYGCSSKNDGTSCKGVGTIRYLAPEVKRDGSQFYGQAVDIFAFGVLIMDVLDSMTVSAAYNCNVAIVGWDDEMHMHDQTHLKAYHQELRDAPPPLWVQPSLWRFIQTFLDPNPALRPTIEQIALVMKDIFVTTVDGLGLDFLMVPGPDGHLVPGTHIWVGVPEEVFGKNDHPFTFASAPLVGSSFSTLTTDTGPPSEASTVRGLPRAPSEVPGAEDPIIWPYLIEPERFISTAQFEQLTAAQSQASTVAQPDLSPPTQIGLPVAIEPDNPPAAQLSAHGSDVQEMHGSDPLSDETRDLEEAQSVPAAEIQGSVISPGPLIPATSQVERGKKRAHLTASTIEAPPPRRSARIQKLKERKEWL